jgi:hypothetical protein
MVFKVSHVGAPSEKKMVLQSFLRSMSGDILECVKEECYLIFVPKNIEEFKEELLSYSCSDVVTNVSICHRNEFEAKEAQDFFLKIEEAQQRILDTLKVL